MVQRSVTGISNKVPALKRVMNLPSGPGFLLIVDSFKPALIENVICDFALIEIIKNVSINILFITRLTTLSGKTLRGPYLRRIIRVSSISVLQPPVAQPIPFRNPNLELN